MDAMQFTRRFMLDLLLASGQRQHGILVKLDPLDFVASGLYLLDCRGDRCFHRFGFAIETDLHYAMTGTGNAIVAPSFKQPVCHLFGGFGFVQDEVKN